METKPSQKIEAELVVSERFPSFKAKEWVIYAGDAPRLPGQPIVHTTLEPGGRAVKEHSAHGQPVLLTRIPGMYPGFEHGYQVKLKFQATLMARHLVPAPANGKVKEVPPLSPAEEATNLTPSYTCDYKAPAFQRWLDQNKLRRARTTSDLDFARQAFLFVRTHYSYFYRGDQDRRVSKLCADKATDCGGMSVLFVGILRANHVSARCLLGRWAASGKPPEKPGGEPISQCHVKAEFFAKGIGWVPVDLSCSVTFDKSKEGLAYFGNDSGDFLAMHVDPDLLVNTIHFGQQRLGCLQGVAMWATGDGRLDHGANKETWLVRKLP
jgi:hypothetical protein